MTGLNLRVELVFVYVKVKHPKRVEKERNPNVSNIVVDTDSVGRFFPLTQGTTLATCVLDDGRDEELVGKVLTPRRRSGRRGEWSITTTGEFVGYQEIFRILFFPFLFRMRRREKGTLR